jgi:hypothetical protein
MADQRALFCVAGVEGTKRGESGARSSRKEKASVAIDPGLLFFFQFCEIGGLAIVHPQEKFDQGTPEFWCEISPK